MGLSIYMIVNIIMSNSSYSKKKIDVNVKESIPFTPITNLGKSISPVCMNGFGLGYDVLKKVYITSSSPITFIKEFLFVLTLYF